jgi:hypothetical protein
MRVYHERKAGGEPSVRYRNPRDRRNRQRRWRDVVQELFDIQADCQVWLDPARGVGRHTSLSAS